MLLQKQNNSISKTTKNKKLLLKLFKVCVVTVTYGKREKYLKKIIQALKQQSYPLHSLIVVNNGSECKISNLCDDIQFNIQVINLKLNTGSALGFSKGISAAIKTSAEYVWLLDDDNQPKSNALSVLINTHKNFSYNRKIALLSLRIVNGKCRNVRQEYRPGDFLGFNLKAIFKKQSERSRAKKYKTFKKINEVKTAPYGGLFIHRDLLLKIGLPRTDFVSYEDDVEYTSRINPKYGTIYQCKDSILHDIEISWSIKEGKLNILNSERATSYRLYYSIRNRCYLEYRLSDKNIIYFVNAIIRVVVLILNGLIYAKNKKALLKNLSIIKQAVIDGITGNLGRRTEYDN